MTPRAQTIAILVKNLDGGGVQKMRLALARSFSAKGYRVDLLVMKLKGALVDKVPPDVRVRELPRATPLAWRIKALGSGLTGLEFIARTLWRRVPSDALAYLPALINYLKQEKPDALLSATPYINFAALLARKIAKVPTRVLVSEHNNLENGHPLGVGAERRRLVALMRIYNEAEMIVGVSDGVARDVAERGRLPRERVATIFNPVVTPEMAKLSAEPLDHPWFMSGAPPVILAVGQLTDRKDYPTLIRAFKRVREQRDVRLVILGKSGNERKTEQEQQKLIDFAASLGVADAITFVGFELNPYRYMSRAAVLVLSSLHEGFPNVIPEALACGCPVVSTDCPSGPFESLDGGRFGALVPIGDDTAMAEAILETLQSPLPAETLRNRGMEYTVDRAAVLYERVFTATNRIADAA